MDYAALMAALNIAMSNGDMSAVYRILNQLEALSGQSSAPAAGSLKNVIQTTNLPHCIANPHGFPATNWAVWQSPDRADQTHRPGSITGRSASTPSYYRVTYSEWEERSGFPYSHWFDPISGLLKEYRFWFEPHVIRRGLVAIPVLVPDNQPEDSYEEAIQQRAALEYTLAYWKKSLPPTNRYHPGETFANGINAALFLWYGPQSEQVAPPVTIPSPDDIALGEDEIAWRLGIIENQRLKSGQSVWSNSYSPLLTYTSLDPEHYSPLSSNRAKLFTVDENNISLPEHLLTLEPFYP